jgi:catechol 2,3-dioxygenase-like lactoylglutathione lyase family enzyme
MNPVIDALVSGFERGTVSRRELIQKLTTLAAAGVGVAAGATTASAAPLKSGSINHSSVLVSDMARSMDFYDRVFGLKLLGEDKANKIARLGTGGKVLVSLRVEPPAGRIDHFAIGVEGFNREAVTKELQNMGITPRENIEFGFYILDPDGAPVQITGI